MEGVMLFCCDNNVDEVRREEVASYGSAEPK